MLEKIRKLIEEYFEMEHGEHITDYLNEIIFFNKDISIRMTYRALKHIVEKRKKDNYSPEKIHNLFVILNEILHTENYRIINNKEIINTFLITENMFSVQETICVIIEISQINLNSYYIRTAFFREIKKVEKLTI